jgi:hypothetical protein
MWLRMVFHGAAAVRLIQKLKGKNFSPRCWGLCAHRFGWSGSSGWQLLPPMDPGGMGELGVVEAEQTESGGLTVRLFKRKYLLGDDGRSSKRKGNRWTYR